MRLFQNVARALTAILSAIVLVACSSPTEEKTTPVPDFMWTQVSQNSVYTVSIEPREQHIPIGEYHEWIIELRDSSDRPVTNAHIGMKGGMPSHGHGLPSQPQISELGAGRYRIEGVRFNMGGPWVIEYRINSAIGQDLVQFDIELAF